ncbi:MAG: hypothetical protein AB8G99_14010 [Planctomycetaceae bacterium]
MTKRNVSGGRLLTMLQSKAENMGFNRVSPCLVTQQDRILGLTFGGEVVVLRGEV